MRTIALFLAATALQVSAQIFPAGAKLESSLREGISPKERQWRRRQRILQ